MADAFKDPWVLLGVEREADDQEIKRAYRALAKRYHPDRNLGDSEAKDRFAEISKAFEQIHNPEARAATAALLRARQNGGISSSLGEDFAAAFGDILEPEPAHAPKETRAEIRISFHESFTGGPVQLMLDGEESCNACGGSGAAPGHRPRRCETCRGAGTHTAGRLRADCAACGGRGFTVDQPCPHCDGGVIHRRRPVTVNIAPGTPDGTLLRVKDRALGGLVADIVVHVNVTPSTVFKPTRNPADLRIDVPLSYSEACLGAQIKVPTPDRAMLLRIPPGTPNGRVLRISGRGMPTLEDPNRRGDLFCRIQVTVPAKLSTQQRRLVTQLSHYDPADLRIALFTPPERGE